MSLKELHSSMPPSRAPALRDVDEGGQLVRQRPISNTISLNSDGNLSISDDDESNRRSSGIATSMWGSRSNAFEADEDASLRPLPPTSPPSPSPSQSSSSYTSDLRTFKSLSASTKPTTLLSIDLNPGVAHIAQAPPTPTSISAYNTPGPSPIQRFPSHVRGTSSGSNALITFATLQQSSSPASSRPPSLGPAPIVRAGTGALQAPAHTSHHPRNNPRPSSPPLDNASVLTLASSAFAAPPPDRERGLRGPSGLYQYSLTGLETSSHLSHGDSTSQFVLDEDEPDASVRALRPRSTRRESWESEVSHWSAGASMALGLGGRSVRTAPSFRTGGQGASGMDGEENMSMLDEDGAWTREETVEEADENMLSNGHDEEKLEGAESALSPSTPPSTSGVTPESEISEKGSLGKIEKQRDDNVENDSVETEDVATPGPAARTIALVPSVETMPGQMRPVTPPLPSATPSKDTQTTPKKGKGKKVELDIELDDDEA